MLDIAVQNELSIPASLKVGAFPTRLAQTLNGQDGGEGLKIQRRKNWMMHQ